MRTTFWTTFSLLPLTLSAKHIQEIKLKECLNEIMLKPTILSFSHVFPTKTEIALLYRAWIGQEELFPGVSISANVL